MELHNERSSQLPTEPRSVEFCQFIRLVERSTHLRIGSDLQPNAEPIALKATPSAHFAATEIAEWEPDQSPPVVRTSFFGLYGPSGALPPHYTQRIIDRARIRDYAFRDFLDLFNHRLLSFFYRSWEKHRFAVAYETSQVANRTDSVTKGLKAFAGLLDGRNWNKPSFRGDDLLFFSGHFANRRPTASALQAIVASAFDVKVHIAQFEMQYMLVSPSDQTRIAPQPFGFSIGNQLGSEAFVGERIRDFENKFRVRLGPMTAERFRRFTPLQPTLSQLIELVRMYVGPQYDFDVQVVLKREEVPPAQLGNSESAHLGWNCWLGNWQRMSDSDDAIFSQAEIE